MLVARPVVGTVFGYKDLIDGGELRHDPSAAMPPRTPAAGPAGSGCGERAAEIRQGNQIALPGNGRIGGTER